jgi:transcriptional regulator with XRE-family HTH domain
MAQSIATPAELLHRFRENVRTLKSIRQVSDTQIAMVGGYASRQLLNHRLTGRTMPDIDDLARIAAALRVEPNLLLAPLSDVTKWIEENPEYKPPKLPKPTNHRDWREVPQPAPARKRRPR